MNDTTEIYIPIPFNELEGQSLTLKINYAHQTSDTLMLHGFMKTKATKIK